MIKGNIYLKGDKSVSHRILMMAAISRGLIIKINNLSNSDDVLTTMACLSDCGALIENSKTEILVKGVELQDPSKVLHCKNSGTTARLLIGLLAGQGINACIEGDNSLMNRPMNRIIKPLKQMGLIINHTNGLLPIQIRKSKLNKIKYTLDVPSAQVKSSLLFAGINTKIDIIDSFGTRDHTERVMKYFKINNKSNNGISFTIPGDISSASFLITATLLIPNSVLTIRKILNNKTRNGFINTCKKMGGKINKDNLIELNCENACDITIKYSKLLEPINIDCIEDVNIIDEIPAFCVLAAYSPGKSKIVNAGELKVKESNRLDEIYNYLKLIGVNIDKINNGLIIKGKNKLYNTIECKSLDHRIIMMVEIFNLINGGAGLLSYDPKVNISFPDFYKILNEVFHG